MEVSDRRVEVTDASAVGEVRRLAADLAYDAGFDDRDAGRLALVVTEAATNLVKHAGQGEILLRPIAADAQRGVDMIALDRGPGIANLPSALRDGFSSTGTPGNGLGAMARLASVFDLYSRAGAGTVVFARVWPAAAPARDDGFVLGGINVPHPGEPVSGDCWAVRGEGQRTGVLVADGLGHGQYASDAARAAAAAFHRHAHAPPAEVLERIHEALRPTRGAAVAVVDIDRGRQLLRFAGLGNIAGTILANGATRSVVSHHGTAGHAARRIQEFTYPWPAGAVLVLHSDGLSSRWTMDPYPGLLERHPMLIAALLYRDCRRARDDTTVVVLRDRS
jgi:anti-sigma regulatory factor (Ser/Thr protein kinase)